MTRALVAAALLAVALLGPIARPAHAQSAPLTWQQAVAEAGRANPQIQAALASLEAAKKQVREAQSGFLPQLTANANSSYGTTGGSSLALTNGLGTVNRKADTSYTASLSANENLFNGLLTQGSVRQAEANVQVSEANLAAVRAQVSYNLVQAYQGLLYAQEYVKLTSDIIQRREENLRMVELRFENGNENKGSYLLSEAYLKQAEFDHLQANDAIVVAQQQLAQVLGRDDATGLQAQGELPVTEPVANADLKKLAVDTPGHLQAVGQEDSADAAVTVARAGFFPTLSLVGAKNWSGNSFIPGVGDSGAGRNAWSVGLNLSFPLFSGGKDYFATGAALQNLTAARLNLANLDRTLLTQLRQALTSYVEAVEKLKVDQTFLGASSVRERIGRAKYNNGLLSFEEWDIIENDLISRQKAALQSARDRVIAEAAWLQALGKGAL